MGTSFTFLKRGSPEFYTIGKPQVGYIGTLPNPSVIALLSTKKRQEWLEQTHRMSCFHQIWSISGSDDYVWFRLPDLWNRQTLAEKLFNGSQNIDDMDHAIRVADDFLQWAGDDELVVCGEEEDEVAEEMGIKNIRKYRETGSLFWVK